jgi:hypothetical protein
MASSNEQAETRPQQIYHDRPTNTIQAITCQTARRQISLLEMGLSPSQAFASVLLLGSQSKSQHENKPKQAKIRSHISYSPWRLPIHPLLDHSTKPHL